VSSRNSILRFFLLFLFAVGASPVVRGTVSDPAKFSHGVVALVTDKSSIQPGSEFTLGIHFTLEPGWHIYWVNSGDSGETPKFTWKLPAGFSAGEIKWPAPSKLGSATVVDFGYERDVTLLLPVRVAASVAANQSAAVETEVHLLICSNMCIPSKTVAKLSLPVKSQPPQADGAGETLIRDANSRLPQASPAGWSFSAVETKDSFVLSIKIPEHASPLRFFPLQASQIENDAQQNFTSSATGFQVKLKKSEELSGNVTRLKGVLVLQGGKAYEISAPVKKSGA
jgi:DsbC/DsbD-like thiol-disulfide interchange protein